VTRALGALGLGAALAAVAVVFDTASLYVPAIALLLAAVVAMAWVGLAALGAGVERERGPATVEEGRRYPLRLSLHTGLLPAPGGELNDPLLTEPVALTGLSSREIRLYVRFARRGRREIEPAAMSIHDPLRLATRVVRAGEETSEVLVLPRVERVVTPGGGAAGRGSGAGDGRQGTAAVRGRAAGSAAELDLDGLRPYRTGTPATRIHWPAVARSGEMLERRLTAEADSAPLVVLDATRPPSEEALDAAVRAAASLVVHLARRDGAALLLPGDRRPVAVARDMLAWPALHARLAMVQAATVRPPLSGARRPGAVLWVSARPDPPRDLVRVSGGNGWLVTPTGAEVFDAAFLVAGCAARRMTRRGAPRPEVAA
jgi:uncharacterized protein (DUF58 family)